MQLTVIGCHGGETPSHRTSAFLINSDLAIDAGSLTSGLLVSDQAKLEACLISHAHLDHIRDLATIADNRCQMNCPPLLVAGTRATLKTLKKHFFNNELWPDFTEIPNRNTPTIQYVELLAERVTQIGRYSVKAVLVDHTIESAGFVVKSEGTAIAYSGDTGPTNRFWEVLSEEPDLKALLMEISFPNRERELARMSGHHTASTLALDLQKYRSPSSLPTLLYHIKPVFQREVELECAKLGGLSLEVLKLKDMFQF